LILSYVRKTLRKLIKYEFNKEQFCKEVENNIMKNNEQIDIFNRYYHVEKNLNKSK
jgi:hypothetical protein